MPRTPRNWWYGWPYAIRNALSLAGEDGRKRRVQRAFLDDGEPVWEVVRVNSLPRQ